MVNLSCASPHESGEHQVKSDSQKNGNTKTLPLQAQPKPRKKTEHPAPQLIGPQGEIHQSGDKKSTHDMVKENVKRHPERAFPLSHRERKPIDRLPTPQEK